MPADVTAFNRRSTELRLEGRLDEAVLAARRATELDADDANAWWQLALALRDRHGPQAAFDALDKVTDLAPDFAEGWCEYALVHHKAGRLEHAVSAYEAALECDPEHLRTLHLLSTALKDRNNDGDKKRRLEVLRALDQISELAEGEQFDLAFLLAEASEFLDAARAYEKYTREHGGSSAYFNLGLTYQSLGRDVDALNAWRMARLSGFDAARVNLVLEPLQIRLFQLRQKVLQKRQPYLQKENWYKHYINPFSLLNVDNTESLRENPNTFKKAKQAVFREIELEEGRVDWLPGLSIDKSTAMALIEALNNEAEWEAHRTVFENEKLCDFLTKGNLEHFLALEDDLTKPFFAHTVSPEALRIIGPKFAAQYDDVLTRAIEQCDLDVVECLFDGRRWILPEHEERCFEGAKRALERLREPFINLAAAADNRTVKLVEIQRMLSQTGLNGLLIRLPMEFHETHTSVGRALRKMSVDSYNREGDAEEAKAILQLGSVCADMSPALSQQMTEDQKFLDEAIAKERKNEAHLSFGETSLDITRAGVAYGDAKMAPDDIVAVRWGLVQTAVSPHTLRFRIAFKDKRGKPIDVNWTTSSELDKQKKFWGQLVDATMHYLMPNIIDNFKKRLAAREPTHVGPIEVVEHGVIFQVKGWFLTKQVISPWRNLVSRLENGSVIVSDITNPKATAVLSLEDTDNAFVLHILCFKKEEGRS